MTSRSRSPPRSKTPQAPVKASAKQLQRMLAVIEDEVLPKTEQGVREGNKVFGAAVLRPSAPRADFGLGSKDLERFRCFSAA